MKRRSEELQTDMASSKRARDHALQQCGKVNKTVAHCFHCRLQWNVQDARFPTCVWCAGAATYGPNEVDNVDGQRDVSAGGGFAGLCGGRWCEVHSLQATTTPTTTEAPNVIITWTERSWWTERITPAINASPAKESHAKSSTARESAGNRMSGLEEDSLDSAAVAGMKSIPFRLWQQQKKLKDPPCPGARSGCSSH